MELWQAGWLSGLRALYCLRRVGSLSGLYPLLKRGNHSLGKTNERLNQNYVVNVHVFTSSAPYRQSTGTEYQSVSTIAGRDAIGVMT